MRAERDKKHQDEEYQKFVYKNVLYAIDPKKLDFVLKILKTEKQKFFEIENLRHFFQEYELLSEEFLDFISAAKTEIKIPNRVRSFK